MSVSAVKKDAGVAIVTGGASGIGWAIASDLAANGWRVVVADIAEAAAQARVRECDGECIATHMNVRDADSVAAAFERALEWGGRIDLAVHGAGIARIGRILELPWDDWEDVLDVNLYGVFRCMREAGRHMLAAGQGAVVNISSISSQRGTPGRSAYVAAKAGVEALTRTAAVEWAKSGVRVNAVAPGYVDTELIQHHLALGEISLDPIIDRTPMGRLAQPAEIARLVRFLASDNASYITGQTLVADGGFLVDYGVGSQRHTA